jgi:hypothetical protein
MHVIGSGTGAPVDESLQAEVGEGTRDVGEDVDDPILSVVDITHEASPVF